MIVSNARRRIGVTLQEEVERCFNIFTEKVTFDSRRRTFETTRVMISSEKDAQRYATETLFSEEWTLLSFSLEKQYIRIMIENITPEIQPQGVVVEINEEFTMEQLTRTQQISWWSYGFEIVFVEHQ